MFVLCLTSTIEETVSEPVTDRLMAEVAAGDRLATERLYGLTKAGVYGLALAMLKNVHDAEDALHDCYVSVLSAIESYRPCGKPVAWIMTVARNICMQKLRDRQRQADIPEEDWEPYLQAKESISPEDKIALSQCMRLLSDDERQIIMLHALSGFKHREIASVMALPLSTVLSKYNRALKKLRTSLTKGDTEK